MWVSCLTGLTFDWWVSGDINPPRCFYGLCHCSEDAGLSQRVVNNDIICSPWCLTVYKKSEERSDYL